MEVLGRYEGVITKKVDAYISPQLMGNAWRGRVSGTDPSCVLVLVCPCIQFCK